MKQNHHPAFQFNFRFLLLTALIWLTAFQSPLTAAPLTTSVQDDTVKALECTTPPAIDGTADDACWEVAKWQTIDQVWIPWGSSISAEDFTGRYKITWSSETDKLYFLVEIIDDVLVKGYQYPAGGWPDYDVVELFIDEDHSGGDHTHNNNAFAYHITAGNDDKPFEVVDLQDGWNPYNFSDHLDCVIKFENGIYTWEIALTVYNENYNPQKTTNPTEELAIGKFSGLSIAYCDNDDPDENPKTRDNFIGSVAVPKSKYNDHWKNASDFGNLLLVAGGNTDVAQNASNSEIKKFELAQNYPNPFNPQTTIAFHLAESANVKLIILNLLGQEVRTLVEGQRASGSHQLQWEGRDESGYLVPAGIYFYRLTVNTRGEQFIEIRKMIFIQ